MATTTTPADTPAKIAARTNELWAQCYVASNEDEAYTQALRQHDTYVGQTITVRTLTGTLPGGDGWDADIDLDGSVDVDVGSMFDIDCGWDGDTLYPEWRVRPINPDQIVTIAHDGRKVRIGDIADLGFTAPGVGTEAGFADRNNGQIIHPETS